MSEYEKQHYKCFNDCFTRKIKKSARPVDMDDNALICPCDGKLSAYKINPKSTFAIKNSRYRVKDLLEDSRTAPKYDGGVCLVFRLCVDNYHRYGYIDDGVIVENKAIKGRLHTVRPIALAKYPVFVQNAREYTIMKTKNFGTVAQVEVGAIMIGKIKNHKKSGAFTRGSEKGMFLYGGSTIVMLFEKDTIKIPEKLFEDTEKDIETPVLFGSRIGIKETK